MEVKSTYMEQYLKLKNLNNGKKPLKKEFLQFYKISELHLIKVFGKDAYSKLQIECGDEPNKLLMERTSIEQILDQYGQLVRKHQRLPATSDWLEADFRPYTGDLRTIHNLKWPDMPTTFLQHYSNKIEWKDVIEILKRTNKTSTEIKGDKKFMQIVDKLNSWTPDRRRIIEEGYKIELRKYLYQYFDLEEEVGESNPDLLIDRKYPIEIKKDPTQSEYDRLLGQMIRHNSCCYKYFK